MRQRLPEIPWSQFEEWKREGVDWKTKVEHTVQRALSRGIATHATLETYYGGGEPDWASEPGELALRMRRHLPAREACLEIHVERSIGEEPYPKPPDPDAGDPEGEPDRTALRVAGVRWLGYVDLDVCLDPDGAEAKRLGLDLRALRAADGWWTFDYKSSRNIGRYALTPEEALADAQGNLYTLSGMRRTHTHTRGMRWVYAQTEGARIAKAVDAIFTEEHAFARMLEFSASARNLEGITTVELATPNPDACPEYGGCRFHTNRGGECNAVRSVRSMIAMGFRDAYKAGQIDTSKAPPPPPTGATSSEQSESAAATNVDGPVNEATSATSEASTSAPPTSTTPPAGAARPPRQPKASTAAKGGSLAALAQVLAESEAAVLDATAKLDAAKAAMRAAL